MPKSPKEIFDKFDLEDLHFMAQTRNIDFGEKTRKQLVKELSEYVTSLGLSVMLHRILPIKILKEVGAHCEWEDNKFPTSKPTIAKKIQETMEDQNPKKYLEGLDWTIIKAIVKVLDLEATNKKEYIDTILETVDDIGLENFFSTMPLKKLKEFVKICDLKVDSETANNCLRALIEQESIKANYKPPAGELPSKTKPEIDKDISVVDLHTHYYRVDLIEFCESNKLVSHGSKKELVERIRRFFDGKLIEDKDKKKEPKKKPKTKDDEEEESDDKKKRKKKSTSDKKQVDSSEDSPKRKKRSTEKKEEKKNIKE